MAELHNTFESFEWYTLKKIRSKYKWWCPMDKSAHTYKGTPQGYTDAHCDIAFAIYSTVFQLALSFVVLYLHCKVSHTSDSMSGTMTKKILCIICVTRHWLLLYMVVFMYRFFSIAECHSRSFFICFSKAMRGKKKHYWSNQFTGLNNYSMWIT